MRAIESQYAILKTKKEKSTMQTPYIPSKDADYALWLANFAALITATPADYGLVAGDAVIIQAAADAFDNAFALATDPLTRTSATIADKDAARAAATATVRPYAQQISRNPAVSDLNKVGVGVNLPNTTRTPIPAPITAPVLTHVASTSLSAQLRFADTTTPTVKAKPFGVTALELRRTIGIAPAVDPDAAVFVNNFTKSPLFVAFDAGSAGKIVTFFGRWVTKSGPQGVAQAGPWSAALSFGVI